jgi:hypothetical protein
MDMELLICARCQATLKPGSGEFWEVRIDAVLDPWPPEFTADDLRRDVRPAWAETLRQLDGLSPAEAMDQIHRHTILHLCQRCFLRWYEDPVA